MAQLYQRKIGFLLVTVFLAFFIPGIWSGGYCPNCYVNLDSCVRRCEQSDCTDFCRAEGTQCLKKCTGKDVLDLCKTRCAAKLPTCIKNCSENIQTFQKQCFDKCPAVAIKCIQRNCDCPVCAIEQIKCRSDCTAQVGACEVNCKKDQKKCTDACFRAREKTDGWKVQCVESCKQGHPCDCKQKEAHCWHDTCEKANKACAKQKC